MKKDDPRAIAQAEKLAESGARHVRLYTEHHGPGSYVAGFLEFNGDKVLVNDYPKDEVVHFGWDSLTGMKYIFGGAKIRWPGDSAVPERCQELGGNEAFAYCQFKDWDDGNWYYLKYGQKYGYVPLDKNGIPVFEAIKLIAPQGEVTPCCWSSQVLDVASLIKCSICRRRLLRCEHCGQLTAMDAGEIDHTKHRCEHCGKVAARTRNSMKGRQTDGLCSF